MSEEQGKVTRYPNTIFSTDEEIAPYIQLYIIPRLEDTIKVKDLSKTLIGMAHMLYLLTKVGSEAEKTTKELMALLHKLSSGIHEAEVELAKELINHHKAVKHLGEHNG
jgi:hypothetical protein